MKRVKHILALILTLALTLSSVAAYTVRYDGIDWSCEDFLATDAFLERAEQILKQAEAEGWPYEDFSAAIGEALSTAYLEQEALQQYEHNCAVDDHSTAAQCEFDSATGTVLRVTNDAYVLYVPAKIDGVKVKAIAPGAITGKTQLRVLMLPPTVERISEPVVADCPEFVQCIPSAYTLITCKLYQNCPAADKFDLEQREEYTETELKSTQILDTDGNLIKEEFTNLPRTLLTRLKIFQGDGTGMDWTSSLTRAQAAAIILRLMGLEEEAQAAAGKPCPFTDVPDWAKGYVNLAYEKNIVKGVGNGLFDPSGRCRAQDFCLMLLRLTDYQEGKDYSWTTAVTDAQMLIIKGKEARGIIGVTEFELFNRLYDNNQFTREYACALIYRMLSVYLTDGKSSLGDKLCAEYGLSTAELYCHNVRLTKAALGDRLDGVEIPERSLLFIAMDDGLKNEVIRTREPLEISAEVQTLVDSLIAGKTSDYDKAKAICTWVAQNIAYDYDTFEGRADNPQDPNSVLKNRYAVCAGFSKLTRYMMAAADIPCLYVSGFTGARDADDKEIGHAWNEVYADGRWFPVDNTWDCTHDYRYGAVTSNGRGLPDINGEIIYYHFDQPYYMFYAGRSFWEISASVGYVTPDSTFY